MPTMLTPAQGAAIFGDVKSLTNYIKNGDKSVFMPDKGGLTSVHSAAQGGHLECLRLLIENGAEVNSVSNKGETPADFAAQGGHIECLRFLRENGGEESGLFLVGKDLKESPSFFLSPDEKNRLADAFGVSCPKTARGCLWDC